MIKLTLMEERSGGCDVLELWRTEHGDVGLCVYEKKGGAQFDFTLDDSDIELLSIMIERARAQKPGQGGGESD